MKQHSGQYILRNSILHKIDPRAKLISLIILIAAITLCDNLYGYATVTAIVFTAITLSKMKIKEVLEPLKRLWLFFAVIFIMNAFFFNSEDSIFSWWIFHLTYGGMLQGLNVILHVAMIMILSNVFMSTTSPIEITNAIEFIISPLALIKVPVADVAMILGVALQFIPTLLIEADTIKKAQIARGARFESTKLLNRAASYFPLIIPIFICAFRRADELSMAMEARGYRQEKIACVKRSKKLKLKDFGAILVSAAVCGGLVYI